MSGSYARVKYPEKLGEEITSKEEVTLSDLPRVIKIDEIPHPSPESKKRETTRKIQISKELEVRKAFQNPLRN